MEEQVTIANGVHAAMTEETPDVFLQLFRDTEGVVQALHECLFLCRQTIRVFWIECREEVVKHRVVLSVEAVGVVFEVNVLQGTASVYVPLRMLVDELPFQFELNDGDGFVHLCDETRTFLVVFPAFGNTDGLETETGVVSICFHGKGGKWQEVDAVAFFQRSHVAEAQRKA